MYWNGVDEDLRRSARNDLAWAFLGALLLSLVAAGAGGLAVGHLLHAWHRARCPADVFFVGDVRIWVLSLSILLFALTSASLWLLSSAAAWLGASGWWARRADRTKDVSLAGFRRGAAWASGVTGAAFILCLPLPLLFQTCFSPEGIFTQNTLWGGLRRHSWSEVTMVETQCRYGRGGWSGDMTLHIADGQTFSLPGLTSEGTWTTAYPALRRSLQGRRFIFDPSQVSPRCDVPELRLLLQRP